jgi:hypothetical protein
MITSTLARAVFAVTDKILDTRRSPLIEHDASDERLCDDLEIGAAARRFEITGRGRGAHAIAHGGLVIARPFLHRSVKIVIARITALQGCLNVSLGQRMPVAQIRNCERPAGAVELIRAAFVILGFAKVRQHVVESPAGVPELPPIVKVLRLTTDIDKPVDRTRSTENLSARRDDVAIVTLGLRLGRITPVEPEIAEKLAKAERNVKPGVPIVRTCLQQKHTMAT